MKRRAAYVYLFYFVIFCLPPRLPTRVGAAGGSGLCEGSASKILAMLAGEIDPESEPHAIDP
jgi:hypothetical protein